MLLNFHIHFATRWGQRLFISGNIPELGGHDLNKALPLPYLHDGHWDLQVKLPDDFEGDITYKYFILNEWDQSKEWEFGENRRVSIEGAKCTIQFGLCG